MSDQIIISTSILSANFANLENDLKAIEQAGADWIHADVMDGHFVPNITMGPFVIETCKHISPLPIDVHLMIEKPQNYVEAFAKAGASLLTIHIEDNPNAHRTLQVIRELGCKAGIAINPGTPAWAIEAVLPFVDMILVMTVNPGFSGQKYIAQAGEKVKDVKKLCEKSGVNPLIQVDGGITAETLPITYQAGARVFVAATSIFKYPAGIADGIAALRNSVP